MREDDGLRRIGLLSEVGPELKHFIITRRSAWQAVFPVDPAPGVTA